MKTPPVAKKRRVIVTPTQYDLLHAHLPNHPARLLVELDIETGLRWGELTELRPADIDTRARILTVSRVVVELVTQFHPNGGRFLVKDYPSLGTEIDTCQAGPGCPCLACYPHRPHDVEYQRMGSTISGSEDERHNSG